MFCINTITNQAENDKTREFRHHETFSYATEPYFVETFEALFTLSGEPTKLVSDRLTLLLEHPDKRLLTGMVTELATADK